MSQQSLRPVLRQISATDFDSLSINPTKAALGWVPSLNFYASSAALDSTERYRVSDGVLFENRGLQWHRVGFCGFRLGELPPLVYDAAPLHAPWPCGMFPEVVMTFPQLITPAMSQEYNFAIRRTRRSNLDAMLSRDIGAVAGNFSLKNLSELNVAPRLASWAGFGILKD